MNERQPPSSVVVAAGRRARIAFAVIALLLAVGAARTIVSDLSNAPRTATTASAAPSRARSDAAARTADTRLARAEAALALASDRGDDGLVVFIDVLNATAIATACQRPPSGADSRTGGRDAGTCRARRAPPPAAAG